MLYRFDQFELDTKQFSLRSSSSDVHVEPLVFDLLCFFVENTGKVLSRDAIIERVWQGRFVSDAAVSSCVKAVRKALGDNGENQNFIRTVRGRGFQFTAPVVGDMETLDTSRSSVDQAQTGSPVQSSPLAPPKIAVLPLFPLSQDPQLGLLGDAVAQEIILELSRLHWLFVIARGSSFQFRGQEVDLAQASRIIGARYFLTGTIMKEARNCNIALELCSAPDNAVVWADRIITPLQDLMYMRSTVAGKIAAVLETRIQLSEALQAARVPTEKLDAWASYHRGLWHMYRFTKHDNDLAAQLFTQSLKIDPGFARAHAGLSFTHFQNAFLGFTPNRVAETSIMRLHAVRGMELDALDPFVNLTMGRTEWLNGDLDAALPWMERSIELSPNYAFAIYNSALVGTLLGDGDNGETRVTKAISLSPIDPLNYAMLATRALSHAVRGDFAPAAEWASRAVRSPNAHVQIYAIAAFAHELTGDRLKAQAYVDHVRRSKPDYGKSDFLKSFPFRDAKTVAQIEQSLQRLGL